MVNVRFFALRFFLNLNMNFEDFISHTQTTKKYFPAVLSFRIPDCICQI